MRMTVCYVLCTSFSVGYNVIMMRSEKRDMWCSREFHFEKGVVDASLMTFSVIDSVIDSVTNGIGFPITLVEHLSGKALAVLVILHAKTENALTIDIVILNYEYLLYFSRKILMDYNEM